MRCILFISLHVRKVLCWGYVIEWCLLIMVSFIHKSLCWEDTTPRWSDLYEIKINGAIFLHKHNSGSQGHNTFV